MFAEGKVVAEIVMELELEPSAVRALEEEWKRSPPPARPTPRRELADAEEALLREWEASLEREGR
jgi:hypothetical protein